MSVLIFLAVLVLLILVHEWGHFIVAKKTGMRVDEFGIGFPPKITGIKKGETEYTLNWLPIGGFVRIWGENYEDNDEESADKDRSRAFSSRPKWAQALVLMAGVTMNVIFAWFLFSITFMIGVPTAVDESSVSEDAQLMVMGTMPDGPAKDLPAGAVITEISSGEQVVSDPLLSEFSAFVDSNAPEAVFVTYKLQDEVSKIEINPTQELDANNPERYLVGAQLVLVEDRSSPFFTAIADGFTATINGLSAICVGLWSLVSDAVVGSADFSQVAGPVGIVGMVGDAAEYGITALLTFTAIISLNLAVINLLPFPALDGGRLLFVAIEAVTRRPIPPQWAGRLNLVGFVFLMLLMIAVTYSDITKLL